MQFLVNILTPSGSLLSIQSTMVLLPAEDGEVGILAEHIPTLLHMAPGTIKVFKNDSQIEYETFIYGGFARFEKNILNILVDETITIKDLDPKLAAQELEKLEEELMATNNLKEIEYLFDQILRRRRIIENAKS